MKKINLKTVKVRRIGKALDLDGRIVIDPKIVIGKPVIRGTRLTVDFILKLFGQGMTQDEILKEFPQLEKEDLLAVLNYAYNIVHEEGVYPLAETRVKA